MLEIRNINVTKHMNNVIHKNVNPSYVMTIKTILRRAGFKVGEQVAFMFNEKERLIIVVGSDRVSEILAEHTRQVEQYKHVEYPNTDIRKINITNAQEMHWNDVHERKRY